MLYKSLKDEIKGLKNEKALLIKESISASETLAMVREDNRLLQRLGKEHREEIFKLQKKLAEYRDAEEQGLLIKIPCKVGDKLYIDSRTIPTSNMDFEEENTPKYFEAIIVSHRKNAKSQYIKFKIRAKWLHEWLDSECGPDSCFNEVEKYFTFPLSAIGVTAFLTQAEAEQALKGDINP